jgi:dipeptidyl aminopeptidase/acylaminoacyl peptidase
VIAAPTPGGHPGEAQLLTKSLDRNVETPTFSPDGASIDFILENHGETSVASIPRAGGSVALVVGGPRAVSAFTLAKDGTLAALVSEPVHPPEVFVARHGAAPRQLTHVNQPWLDEVRLGAVEQIEAKSPDGTKVQAFVVKPPGFAPELKYPALLRIHGGPVSQYDWGFSFEAQLFAANGYVVVLPNPRGSSGYGQDFCRAIFADWGNKDGQDVLAALDAVIASGSVAADRLGVGGWSYGAILTDSVISQTTRFKAAIAGAGGGLWASFYGHDHYQHDWEAEAGLPWRAKDVWDKLSAPFYNVEKITTPTLFMGGAIDWNVPVIGSENMYQALRRLGRTTQLVVYPGEHHGIRRPSYQRDRLVRYLAWYGKYVKGEDIPTPKY